LTTSAGTLLVSIYANLPQPLGSGYAGLGIKTSRAAPAHARQETAQVPETQAKAVQTGNGNAAFI